MKYFAFLFACALIGVTMSHPPYWGGNDGGKDPGTAPSGNVGEYVGPGVLGGSGSGGGGKDPGRPPVGNVGGGFGGGFNGGYRDPGRAPVGNVRPGY